MLEFRYEFRNKMIERFSEMQYIKATADNIEIIYEIVQETIKTIYPNYYPDTVVDFFCELHNKANIKKDIEKGSLGILSVNGVIVGTGCCDANHITRLFVLPEYQGKGYGSFIMNCLEKEISEKYKTAILDASLSASKLYEKRGYKTVEHCTLNCDNNRVLVYEIMEKPLPKITSSINYNGKIFVPKINSENGEVNDKTVFSYHQNGDVLSADYSGGGIIQSFMIGTVSKNGELNFHYQHINTDREIRIGKCHSVPHITENGKTELYEEWQWLNGDKSKGSSTVVEQ